MRFSRISNNLNMAWCLVMVCLLQASGTSSAQESPSRTTYLDVSNEASKLLRTAESYVTDRNWQQALDMFDRLMNDFGDKVVTLPNHESVHVSVSSYCQRKILELPNEAVLLYRNRVDPRAEQLFRTGLENRDISKLTMVVEHYFGSSWGDDALNTLGGIAFEQGRLDQAYIYWSRIRPRSSASVQVTALNYFDSDLDLSHLAAKRIVTLQLLGRIDEARVELNQLNESDPNASGRLGSYQGLLVPRLKEILTESPIKHSDALHWSTFGGSASRTKVLGRPIEVGSVQWTAKLPQFSRTRPVGRVVQFNSSNASLSYYPVISGRWLVVAASDRVIGFDLREGPVNQEPTWEFELYSRPERRPVRSGFSGVPRYTLSVHDGRAFVRLGSDMNIAPRGVQFATAPESFVLCLDIEQSGKELWRVEPDEGSLIFDGAPVVDDGKVYVALTGGSPMTSTAVACYDEQSGTKLWTTRVCESSTSRTTARTGEVTHNLLTVAAGRVFYNTNLGAVAALDANTGKIQWAFTYPRQTFHPRRIGESTEPVNGPNPCIYSDGVVMVRPSDALNVYGIDAISGDLRWRAYTVPIKQLIGAARGKLFCATDQALLTLDIQTGDTVQNWSGGPGLWSFGRGLLAGDLVYFPVKTDHGGEIYVLKQDSLVASRPPVRLTQAFSQLPGNLAAGDDYIAVAHASGLTVYCEYSVLIKRYKDMIAVDPKVPEPHFRLARAAESVDDIEVAKKHYRIAIRESAKAHQDMSLTEQSRHSLFSILRTEAAEAALQKDFMRAEKDLLEAIELAVSDELRVGAKVDLGDMWRSAGQPSRALAVYHGILSDPAVQSVQIELDDHRRVRGDLVSRNNIEQLVATNGRVIYEEFDKLAEEGFRKIEDGSAVAEYLELIRLYPEAVITPRILMLVSEHYLNQDLLHDAIVSLNQVLRYRDADKERRSALVHLAQIHELLGEWTGAAEHWKMLSDTYGQTSFSAESDVSTEDYVRNRLAELPYPENPSSSSVSVPLGRKWTASWSNVDRAFFLDGGLGADPLIVLSGRNQLRSISAWTGTELWDVTNRIEALWARRFESTLLLGSDRRVVAVDVESGQQRWSYAMPAQVRNMIGGREIRVGRGSGAVKSSPNQGPTFRLVADRLHVQEGDSRITCLSVRDGTPIWVYEPKGINIASPIYCDGRQTVFRTVTEEKLIVLDEFGRVRFEIPGHYSWTTVPVQFAPDQVCIADSTTIRLLDTRVGVWLWERPVRASAQEVLPIASRSGLIVLIDGNQLLRLDPVTGEELWAGRVSSAEDGTSPRNWSIDAESFYCVTSEHNLRAFDLKTGKLRWQKYLAGSENGWQLLSRGKLLVAVPRRINQTAGLPAIFCSKSDGQFAQRMVFQPRGERIAFHWSSELAFIGSENHIWAIAPIHN